MSDDRPPSERTFEVIAGGFIFGREPELANVFGPGGSRLPAQVELGHCRTCSEPAYVVDGTAQAPPGGWTLERPIAEGRKPQITPHSELCPATGGPPAAARCSRFTLEGADVVVTWSSE